MTHEPVYYPPSPNLNHRARSFAWYAHRLMQIVGWMILVPSTLAVIICGFCVPLMLVTWIIGWTEIGDFISWIVLAAVCGAMMSVGVWMTGIMGDR